VKMWKDLHSWSEREKPREIGNAIVIETSQCRFTINEKGDGSLEINGSNVTDSRTHSICLALYPRSSNVVGIGFNTIDPTETKPA